MQGSVEKKWLLEEKYGGVESEAFHADCEHLQAGEPLGYVIGFVPFLDCKIYLDSKPLIPRPETEYWAEKAIAEIGRVAPTAPRVLDLCAGSGCIGVAVAKAIPDAHVTFAELESHHLPTIKKNVQENTPSLDIINDIKRGCVIVESDRFEGVQGTFDFILSNPPYIDPMLDRTEQSVKEFEPHNALYGGTRGMELITRIITDAPEHLTKDGQLWLEHEPEQSAEIRSHADASGFSVSTHNDQYGIERYSILMLK